LTFGQGCRGFGPSAAWPFFSPWQRSWVPAVTFCAAGSLYAGPVDLLPFQKRDRFLRAFDAPLNRRHLGRPPGQPGPATRRYGAYRDGTHDSRATVYSWFGQSDDGELVIRGRPVVIEYFQGGARGQGRIIIELTEVDRLLQLIRVVPPRTLPHQERPRQSPYPGITFSLGRPKD